MPSSRHVGRTSVFDVARPQRVLGLHGRDRMDGMGAPDRLGRRLAEPEMADLALLDELRHRSDRLLDGHVRVDAVLVVQVDVIGAEPLQRALDRAADMLGRAVERPDGGHVAGLRRVHPPRELRREHVLVAMPLDGAAHELLVGHRPVQLRRVQEVDSELQRALDGRGRLAFIGRPVEGGHPHASEPESRDLERSEPAPFHCPSNIAFIDRVVTVATAATRARTRRMSAVIATPHSLAA